MMDNDFFNIVFIIHPNTLYTFDMDLKEYYAITHLSR